MPETTILLADDHPRLLEKVRRFLEPNFTVVGAVADGSALIAAALELKPRIVITDLMMEPTNGLEAATAILTSSYRRFTRFWAVHGLFRRCRRPRLKA
jgi:DNA-binding NarL/FixJ family response regulator